VLLNDHHSFAGDGTGTRDSKLGEPSSRSLAESTHCLYHRIGDGSGGEVVQQNHAERAEGTDGSEA
jgi:hypothetical protein